LALIGQWAGINLGGVNPTLLVYIMSNISIEFFPPNTPVGEDKLHNTIAAFLPLSPEFFSVTYGAGGVTQDKTQAIVLRIAEQGHQAAPHLSCVGSKAETIRALLDTYKAHGIKRLIALRGDLPSGMVDPGEFRYAADLVAFVKQHYGEQFFIEVAAYPEYHPQAKSPAADLQAFVSKVKAGADGAITQFFYTPEAYFAFVDAVRGQGVNIPIVPGIMPINSFAGIMRFSERDGIDVPRWVRLKMEKFYDDSASIKAFGLDVVTGLCERLIAGGAPSLHFYSLNQSALTLEIASRLGLLQK
jgi:methylenetetrahydrofolate reductase (NADPH)